MVPAAYLLICSLLEKSDTRSAKAGTFAIALSEIFLGIVFYVKELMADTSRTGPPLVLHLKYKTRIIKTNY